MKRASNSFARPIDTPDGRDERTSKDGLPWDIRPVPHAEIDELGSEHEHEESRTSGTSEPEQNRARPSSPHPPSESLNEILQSLLVVLTKVCISTVSMHCNQQLLSQGESEAH